MTVLRTDCLHENKEKRLFYFGLRILLQIQIHLLDIDLEIWHSLSDTIHIFLHIETKKEIKKLGLYVWFLVPIVGDTLLLSNEASSCQWVKNGITVGHQGQHIFQNILDM
jgi:hypothetical protein